MRRTCILISDKVDIEYKHTIHIVIAIITSLVQKKSFSKNEIEISKVFSNSWSQSRRCDYVLIKYNLKLIKSKSHNHNLKLIKLYTSFISGNSSVVK